MPASCRSPDRPVCGGSLRLGAPCSFLRLSTPGPGTGGCTGPRTERAWVRAAATRDASTRTRYPARGAAAGAEAPDSRRASRSAAAGCTAPGRAADEPAASARNPAAARPSAAGSRTTSWAGKAPRAEPGAPPGAPAGSCCRCHRRQALGSGRSEGTPLRDQGVVDRSVGERRCGVVAAAVGGAGEVMEHKLSPRCAGWGAR